MIDYRDLNEEGKKFVIDCTTGKCELLNFDNLSIFLKRGSKNGEEES